MLGKAGWLFLVLGASACLGGGSAQVLSPADQLAKAEDRAKAADWPEARAAAVAFFGSQCGDDVKKVADCVSAQLVRGEAELALGTPDTALLAFEWAQKNGDASTKEQATQGATRARSALDKQLGGAPASSWLAVQQDFADNSKFGPDRALYSLDGAPLGQVTRRSHFADRQHRVLGQAIPSGHHTLGVEIHWKGEGTFDSYFWSSFRSVELDADAGGAVIVSLDVTYKDGGPSDSSVNQELRVRSYAPGASVVQDE